MLTEVGRTTAEQVAEALQGLPFAAIYSSPLRRAFETATVIREKLGQLSPDGTSTLPPVVSHQKLLEIDLPLWEGLSRHEVEATHGDLYHTWQTAPHTFSMPMGEGKEPFFPVLALHEQARQFWQELLQRHPNQTVLVVAHNGINRCLLSTAMGIGPDRYHSILQSNCGINVLNFPGGWGEGVQLESMNLTAHAGQPLPKSKSSERVRLLLVRHGETDWNRDKRFQGQIDVPLNDNGRAQAQKAADFLKSVQIDFAVTSPMLRPKETAEIILQHHPEVSLQTSDGLREISHGLWEGKLEEEIQELFSQSLQDWKVAPETVQMPEGENLQQVWDRAVVAWDAIVAAATPGSTGLVVAHDATNKVILCYLLGLQTKDFWAIKQGNGAVTVIDYPKGAGSLPSLQAMNITSHLGGVLDRTAAGAL